MKLAVVSNTVPFLRGGAEVLADSLCERLTAAGHSVDLFRLPFSWEPIDRIADGMLAASLTRIAGVDRVIALKFPAYLVPHDDKVLWLLHQFRQFYDLWDTPFNGYPESGPVADLRRLVRIADTNCFVSSTRVFTNSAVTAHRLLEFNGVPAEVLHPPLADPDIFNNVATGDYIFAGGRINSFKRQLLAVEAMRHTRSSVRLVVAGAAETTEDLASLQAARASCPRPDRIVLMPRFISEQEKADLVNGCLACVYCPIDEDSYGYVTLEGAQAGKALVTTDDSGGITQLAIEGRTGLVRPPDPRELAGAFDALASSPTVAEALGRGARERVDELGISWPHVLDRLLT